MSNAIKAAVAAMGAGVATAVLLWPTSDCISTLIQPLPGVPDPNIRSCKSVIGLPSTIVIAAVASLLVASVVYLVVRRRVR